jgi:hypothetical protein
MPHTYSELFERLPDEQPPRGVFEAISRRVIARLYRRALAYRSLGYAALAGCIAGSVYLVRAVVESDIPRYISLLSTDGSSVLSYWKELAMSVSDSLPIPEMIFVLVFVIACLSFLRASSRYHAHSSRLQTA